MALTHLMDTSVLTRLRKPPVWRALAPLALDERLGRATMSDLEVGHSARNAAEWDQLVGAVWAFELVEMSATCFFRALEVQRLLAARGQRGRKLPDLLIAAAAERAGLAVLHCDADFDLIAGVTGQPAQWVVPRGSVD